MARRPCRGADADADAPAAGAGVMAAEPVRDVIDVSSLPTYGFGNRSVVWWGTVGMMAIEGSVFALLLVAYAYLRGRSPEWPLDALPPMLFWGTANLILLLVSTIPNQLAKRAAERLDLPGVHRWLLVCLGFGVLFIVFRWYEFQSLNIRWDTNAYGSVTWALLGFHSAHIVTDVLDTAVLTVLMFTGPISEKRFVDVSENAMYWYFVVLSWLPIYAAVYLAPRLH
jgi:heme/copper-type cytochrome/quinol oxidase subunit 3